jgi:hypothetical protein
MRFVPSADHRCFSGHCLCLKYTVRVIFCGFVNDAVGICKYVAPTMWWIGNDLQESDRDLVEVLYWFCLEVLGKTTKNLRQVTRGPSAIRTGHFLKHKSIVLFRGALSNG